MNPQPTNHAENLKPGLIVLFGSGETSNSGRRIFNQVLSRLYQPPTISLVETPSGFEPNSEKVIGRVAEFINQRLQNYRPDVKVVPARKKGTTFGPDNPEILAPLFISDMVFMGPGSPTYAVNQLKNSLAWQIILASHYAGVCLVFASAATVAISKHALPVYEIYKVGEDLHWKQGLDFFGIYGLSLVIIPHWNNQDGGQDLDTSRCFIGEARFEQLLALLPGHVTVLGIDEKTALILNMEKGTGQVVGLGNVIILNEQHKQSSAVREADLSSHSEPGKPVKKHRVTSVYPNGETFLLDEFLTIKHPSPGRGVPEDVWRQVLETRMELKERRTCSNQFIIPEEVAKLVKKREIARRQKEWVKADQLRDRIAEMGWRVKDTPQGSEVEADN